MFRYRLRTLLIVLALGPPVIAWLGWPALRLIVSPPHPPFLEVIGPLGTPLESQAGDDPFATPIIDKSTIRCRYSQRFA